MSSESSSHELALEFQRLEENGQVFCFYTFMFLLLWYIREVLFPIRKYILRLWTCCSAPGCSGVFNRLFWRTNSPSVQVSFAGQIITVQCLVLHGLLCKEQWQHSQPLAVSSGGFLIIMSLKTKEFRVAGPKDYCSPMGGHIPNWCSEGILNAWWLQILLSTPLTQVSTS